MNNQELCHYGVKGMRWGHRKVNKYSALARTWKDGAKDWDIERKEEVGKLRAQGKTKQADRLNASYKKQINENLNRAKKYETKAATEKAKLKRADAIDSKVKELNRGKNFLQKIGDTSETKRAAKYIVDKKMSAIEAMNKARRHEKAVNGAAAIAGYLATSVIAYAIVERKYG